MGDRSRRARCAGLGIGTAACVGAVIAFGWWIGAGGWPGEPSACIAAGDCSCEAFSDGLVVQRVNTLSSLVFVGAGLTVLRWPTADRLLRGIYAALVAFLGIGSAAFHASMTEWGGWLDLLAIHLFVGFVVLVGLGRLLDRSPGCMVLPFAAAAIVAGPLLWWMDNGLGKYTVAALVVVVGVLELRLTRTDRATSRRWLGSAAALFILGLAVQWLGRGGGALCNPESVWQVHAAWHGLAAAGAVVLGRYLLPTP